MPDIVHSDSYKNVRVRVASHESRLETVITYTITEVVPWASETGREAADEAAVRFASDRIAAISDVVPFVHGPAHEGNAVQ